MERLKPFMTAAPASFAIAYLVIFFSQNKYCWILMIIPFVFSTIAALKFRKIPKSELKDVMFSYGRYGSGVLHPYVMWVSMLLVLICVTFIFLLPKP